MEELGQIDKSLRDLIEIIHLTENISTNIHGMLDEAEIYRIVIEEFAKSKRFTASILLLADRSSKLRIVETSLSPEKLKAGEKVTGLRLKGYKIDLNKSTIFNKIITEYESFQTTAGDIINELFPRPLAHLISTTLGYEKKKSVLTPLNHNGKIIGVLGISSIDLTDQFMPIIKNLAHHISNTLELADEHARCKHIVKRTLELRSVIKQLRREISRRKQAKQKLHQMAEALKASKAGFCSIVNKNPHGILIVDSEGVVRFINPAAKSLFSHKLVGQSFDYPVKVDETMELDIISGDGQPGRAEMRVAETVWEGNKAYLVTLHDITDRKRVEEALQKERDRLETVTKNIGAGLAIISRDYRTIWANDVLKQIFGDVEGKLCYLTYNQRAEICPNCGVKEIFTTGKDKVVHEQVGKDANGNTIWSQIIATSIKDEAGEIMAALEVVVPITERKKAEEAVKRSEKKYRDLLEGINDGYCLVQDWKIVFVNKAFVKIFEYSFDEMMGQDFTIFIAPESIAEVTKYYRLAMEGKPVPEQFEFNAIHKNGGRIAVEVRARRTEYEGKPAIVGILRDVTERRRMEKHLIQQEKLMAVGRFTAGIAHEINNPLDILLSKIECLQMEGISVNKLSEDLNAIKNQVLRISQVTQALLSHSKGFVVDFVPLDVNLILESVLFTYKQRDQQKHIIIEKSYSNNLTNIMGDRFELEEVFTNILYNAVDAIPEKGKIVITSKMENKNFVRVEFSDSGAGIAEENLGKVFDPFFTTKQPSGGTGLGLFICNKIIKSHRGSIKIKSQLGKGTITIISLPSAKKFNKL